MSLQHSVHEPQDFLETAGGVEASLVMSFPGRIPAYGSVSCQWPPLPVARRGAKGFGFDMERAIYLTVLHRLMVSGSDRHASRWHHGFRIHSTGDLTLDHAYHGLARGGPHHNGNAFFDTTSLYFEGAGGQTLGQFGHSKDYRPHLKGRFSSCSVFPRLLSALA
jgi:hypothetical protein